MLWHIELKFCIWLCFTVLQIKFECRQFASILVRVMPLLELSILEIHSFPHFSLTCFDILSWNFAYDFVLQYFRWSSSVVNLRQFLWELCLFWNFEYWKYTVFRTFLLHALTYWAEILHMTLFYCTSDEVRVSSICVNFCGSYASFGTLNTGNTHIWLCFTVLQIKFECRQFASIFMGVMPLLELRILEIHSFPHFSLTCFDILSWNVAYNFVLLYYRSSSSVVNLRQCLWELCPSWNLEYWKYAVFCTFSYMLWNTCMSWNFAYVFVLLYYRLSSSVVNLRQFLWELCPFWNFQYWRYTVFRTFLLHDFTYWAGIFHITLFTVL